MKYQETLNAIYAQLDRIGDLPVFSATVNHIRQISSSRETDAMALAIAVMKDANLTTKLLRLANSNFYNRGSGKITAISRAVVLIGFERIQNLCMTLKLIESFKEKEPGTGVEDLLVAAVLNASAARDLAASAGVRDIEETYICGLLYGLGEIVVAFTLPELYRSMLRERKHETRSWAEIQQEIMGGDFVTIGQDLAQSWGFPKSVVTTINPLGRPDGSSADGRVNHAIIAGCHQVFEHIYQRGHSDGREYASQIDALSEVTRQSPEKLEEQLHNSVREVCDHLEQYGLSHRTLMPPLRVSGNDALDETTRKIAYYVHSRQERKAEREEPEENGAADQQRLLALYNERQLYYLERLNDLMTEKAAATKILATAVEGIETSSSLDRVAFCLRSGSGDQLAAKLLEGENLEPLLGYFKLNRKDAESKLFFRILDRGVTLLVTDCKEAGWQQRLPAGFQKLVKPAGMILAPLVVSGKPIGLLYADKLEGSGAVEDRDFRVFNQFLVQCRIALDMGRHFEDKR